MSWLVMQRGICLEAHATEKVAWEAVTRLDPRDELELTVIEYKRKEQRETVQRPPRSSE